MARPVQCSETLRTFIAGVMRAAEDNAEEVVPVVLAVVGGILACADPETVSLQDADDGAGGVVWAAFGGERMAFRFNRLTAMIELRAGGLDGHPLRRFGRRSLDADITNFFGPDRAARAARRRP